MITPSFGLTATERVLPSMALDFTTASLDSRVTFTRSGNTATVVNSSGLIATINANLPRFDFDPVTLACKGLLIEEARTNLLTYSNDFSNAIWSKNSSSITSNVITSPDGTVNASKLVEAAATAEHTVNRSTPVAIVAGSSNTLSVFAKKGERTAIELFYVNATYTSGVRFRFNLTAGTVGSAIISGTASATSATITNFGNDWFKCSVTAIVDALSIAANFNIALFNGSTTFYAGNGTSGAFIYGAQLEAGAFGTSYIPTVASQVTRTADVASMTGANFSSWYTATTGAAVVWAIPQTATGTRPLVQFDDTTANEIIALRGNVADPEMSIVDGGVAQAQIDVGTIVANTAYKLSGGWDTNNCAAAKDGGTVGTDVAATIPTPTQLRIGSDGTNYASAWVQKILYYPQRLINAEVQAISKL
jgi:hypothetical protein